MSYELFHTLVDNTSPSLFSLKRAAPSSPRQDALVRGPAAVARVRRDGGGQLRGAGGICGETGSQERQVQHVHLLTG